MNKEELKDKYFTQGLNQLEFEEFQKLLEGNSQFAEDFYSELEIQQGIAQIELRNLKARLQNLDKNKSKPSTILKLRSILKYAAVILVILGTSYFLLNPFKTSQDYFTTYFEPYPNHFEIVTRSDGEIDNPVALAFYMYESQEYNKAYLLFEQAYQLKGEPYLRFYKAISLLAIDKDAEAIDLFIALKSELKEDALLNANKWYLALAYAKNKRYKESKAILKSLKTKDSPMAQFAKDLLQELP